MKKVFLFSLFTICSVIYSDSKKLINIKQDFKKPIIKKLEYNLNNIFNENFKEEAEIKNTNLKNSEYYYIGIKNIKNSCEIKSSTKSCTINTNCKWCTYKNKCFNNKKSITSDSDFSIYCELESEKYFNKRKEDLKIENLINNNSRILHEVYNNYDISVLSS